MKSVSLALAAEILCAASTLIGRGDLVAILTGISGLEGPLYRCTGISGITSSCISSFRRRLMFVDSKSDLSPSLLVVSVLPELLGHVWIEDRSVSKC